MLLGYIPTTRLEHIDNKAARRCALANLFHACMHKFLSPIELYGEMGIAMVTGDGIWYRCHPILATFIGDYPEQSLVVCTYNGTCPKCIVPRDELENYSAFPLRDFNTAVAVFGLSDGDPTTFHAACQNATLKPTYCPFWQHLPFTNIFLSITPDVLHQIHQGVTKHLVRWLTSLASDEIDVRCRRFPVNHNARHFHKGITGLSRPTGREHKDVCRILLRVAVDLPLPGNQSSAHLNRAIRALLDFIYFSQYPVHTSESLNVLDTALRQFHENKDIFIELEVREHFNFLKLHSLVHYRTSISLFGMADNYNTKQSERLHIDFTKNAYHATNFKQEYEQMTAWLQRQEAVDQHAAFIQWCSDGFPILPTPPSAYPSLGLTLFPFLTAHPSEKGVTFEVLSHRYGAIDFQDALADFIVRHNFPGLSASIAWRRADNTLLPFRQVSVFHKIKFTNHSLDVGTINALHIRPLTYCTTGKGTFLGDLILRWSIMELDFEWFKLGPCSSSFDQQRLQFFSAHAQLLQTWCTLSGFPHSRCLQTTPMACTEFQGFIKMGDVWLASYL